MAKKIWKKKSFFPNEFLKPLKNIIRNINHRFYVQKEFKSLEFIFCVNCFRENFLFSLFLIFFTLRYNYYVFDLLVFMFNKLYFIFIFYVLSNHSIVYCACYFSFFVSAKLSCVDLSCVFFLKNYIITE